MTRPFFKTFPISIVLTLFLFKQAISQDTTSKFVSKKVVFAELGGTGLQYSIGVEKFITVTKNFNLSFRGAVSYPVIPALNRFFFPCDFTTYIGNKIRFLIGGGVIGLIGTSPFPIGQAAQLDYRKLAEINPYFAVRKYGDNAFQQGLDLAYTARIGVTFIRKKFNWYLYMNCFYMRLSLEYYFQSIWPGVGISRKF